jgi:hypothetical protein
VPNTFSVHYFMKGDWHTVELEATSENFHCVQFLGRENWLLVRGRASGSDDRNATVYDMQGRRLWSFHAGDGIEDVPALFPLLAEEGAGWGASHVLKEIGGIAAPHGQPSWTFEAGGHEKSRDGFAEGWVFSYSSP